MTVFYDLNYASHIHFTFLSTLILYNEGGKVEEFLTNSYMVVMRENSHIYHLNRDRRREGVQDVS